MIGLTPESLKSVPVAIGAALGDPFLSCRILST